MLCVSSLSPLDQCLNEHKLGHFLPLAASVGFINLINKLQLLLGIIKMVLSNSAVNHANEWCEVALIKCGSFLVSGIGASKVSLDLLLITDFGVECRVLWLQTDCQVKHLHGLLKNDILSPTESGEKSSKVIV